MKNSLSILILVNFVNNDNDYNDDVDDNGFVGVNGSSDDDR